MPAKFKQMHELYTKNINGYLRAQALQLYIASVIVMLSHLAVFFRGNQVESQSQLIWDWSIVRYEIPGQAKLCIVGLHWL